MKNKRKTLLTSLAVLTFGAALAIAAPHDGDHGRRHGHGRHGGMNKMSEKLNLTDVQKQQIQDIRKSMKEQNAATFESSHQTRKEFRAAKKADDTAKLQSLKPVMESQRAQIKEIRQAAKLQIASVLTPEQNAQWEQLKTERKQSCKGKKSSL